MGKYTIKKGDTLSDIASEYGVTTSDLAKANGISNPNLIYAGATLVVPDIDKLGIGDSSSKKEEDTGFKYTPFEYGDYKESQSVTDAKNKKDETENALANYGDFSYKNQAGLDELMNKILNREDFSYDFNTDALYQQYKDKYIKQGKMAMQDVIGQASAMTGGYGNSYAASVGNQAYQASLENLNDVIPELYQMAYDRYNQKGQDMLNQYGLLSDDYNRELGTWETGYNRLVNDRTYYGTQYDNERSWDYGKWSDNRNFEQGQHNTEQGYLYQDYRDKITDEQWQTQFDEAKRQYDESMALNREQFNWQKEQANKSAGGGVNDTPVVDNEPVVDDEPVLEPKETRNTNSFIGNHQTKSEFMARGDKSYDEYKEYIENSLEEGMKLGIYSFTDEELAYIVQYYGLS